MKTCKLCDRPKKESEYYANKSNKDRLFHTCKSCTKERRRSNYFNQTGKNEADYRKTKEQSDLKKKLKKLKLRLYKKRRLTHTKCPTCKEWREGSFKRVICKGCNYLYFKKRMENPNNLSKQIEYHKVYAKIYNKNPEVKAKKNEYAKKYNKYRRATDPLYKLKGNLRCRTTQAFRYKNYKKGTKTEELLGVSWEGAKKHIERQFTKGMTWENHGDWHIDHIYPLSKAKTESELIKLCHYTNLQPLWASENISKGDNIIEHQIKLRL